MSYIRSRTKISPASTLSYLDNCHVFVGSQCGDCQIIRLQADKIFQSKGKRKATGLTEIEEEHGDLENLALDVHRTAFTAVDTWANIAPVLDFCVVEGEGGGSVSAYHTRHKISPDILALFRLKW
jgi:hypothetical protein